jgi:sugar phosphate isomerase/epimerase
MPSLTRRQLFQSAAAAGVAVAAVRPLGAIEPIPRSGLGRIHLSLAGYSFRQWLNLAKKPRPDMTLADFIDLSATMPLDAVELTGYYFAETTPEYLAALKGRCTRHGLDVSGTAIANDFCLRDPAKVKDQIEHVKKWVEHTSRLGGKTVRIFAGKVEKGDDEDKARARCALAIQEACDYAGKYGIYLALENHGGITATLEQILALVKAVEHNWFGVNLDTGNFHTPDPYGDLEKLAPYAVVVQVKTEVYPHGKKEPSDLKRLVEILRKADFRGYAALEYEGDEDARKAVPRHIGELRRIVG